MKKPILKRKTRNQVIIALAYAHRYLWPLGVIVIPMIIGGSHFLLVMGLGCILFAAYSVIGYQLRWKHIYCSYQSAQRAPTGGMEEMTPENIRWGRIKKSDVYGTSAIWAVLGIAAIVVHCLYI